MGGRLISGTGRGNLGSKAEYVVIHDLFSSFFFLVLLTGVWCEVFEFEIGLPVRGSRFYCFEVAGLGCG
jgi:hypothetical protein